MKKFHILLVRPTRYDNDGYPIQWHKSAMPSNTLASLYAIAEICRDRKLLGDDIEIELHPIDESNKKVDHKAFISMMQRDAGGMLCLVGVQTNQWPRATDMSQRYLKAGGLLVADACCGRVAFDAAFRRELAKALPESRLERLPADHPLYHCHNDITRVEYTPRVREDYGPFDTPELEGISIDGRLAVIYSKFDLGNGWEQFPHAYSYGVKDDYALQLGTNILVYAVTH